LDTILLLAVVVDVAVVVVVVVVVAAAADVNSYVLVRSAVVFYLAGLVIVDTVVNATLKIVTAFVIPSPVPGPGPGPALVESSRAVETVAGAGLQMPHILSPVLVPESTNIHPR
jgi:hypothetical protein